MVEEHADELAELITIDNGKPLRESTSEVSRTADAFRYYAGWVTKVYGETNPSDLDSQSIRRNANAKRAQAYSFISSKSM